jgi:hypothetical protein
MAPIYNTRLPSIHYVNPIHFHHRYTDLSFHHQNAPGCPLTAQPAKLYYSNVTRRILVAPRTFGA